MTINIYRRYWLLYFAVKGTGVDQLIKRMQELAKMINSNHPQVEEALVFYEENFLSIMLNGEIYPPHISN